MNSSTPFSSATSSANPVFVPHAPNTAPNAANTEENGPNVSIETRSILLGRALAQRSEPQHPIVALWLERGHQSIESDRKVPSVLLDHLRALVASDPSSLTASELDMKRWCDGTATALQWLSDRTTHWPNPLREIALLKTLIPCYLANSQSSPLQSSYFKTACGHTNTLLSELMTIVEIEKSLSHCGFTEWLTDRKRISQEPIESLRHSFQIQLSDVAIAMCTRITQRSDRKISALLRSIHAVGTIQEYMHRGWWSIALQWCNGQTAMTPPPELKIGLVPWDRLRAHWNELLRILKDPSAPLTLTAIEQPTHQLDQETSGDRSPIEIDSQQSSIPRHGSASNGSASCGKTPVAHHDRPQDARLVEIRAANDPLLQENLERLLDDCRMNQGILSVVVIRMHVDKGAGLPNTTGELQRWQSEYIRVLDPLTDPQSISGFLSENGDLALVIQDIERSEIVQIVRDGFAEMNQNMVASRSLAANRPTPFVAGISTVSGPSRSFVISQLIDAAWRCLDGAIVQGAGSVKSLEVF